MIADPANTEYGGSTCGPGEGNGTAAMAWFRAAGPLEYGMLFGLSCVGVGREDIRREWRQLVETGLRDCAQFYMDVVAVFDHFDCRRCQDMRIVVPVAANTWGRAE